MSDLDDFNRRMTFGNMLGPPRNAAESAAQSFIDARQPQGTTGGGGGGIDLGPHSIKPLACVVVAGIVLLGGGAYASGHFADGAAIMGLIAAVIGGLMLMVGGVLLTMVSIGAVVASAKPRQLALCGAAAVAGWWLSPWLGLFIGFAVPQTLAALAAAGLVFVLTMRRR
jgi:hypothetical protein